MPILKVVNTGKVGLVKDIPPHELPIEAWSETVNVRFCDNKAKKITGHELAYTPSIAPLALLAVPTKTNYYWVYAGIAKVYAVDALTAVHTDITRIVGGDYTADSDINWNGGILGGVPILNNGVDEPQMWLPVGVGTPLANLTNWPASTTARVIRPFKNALIAADITKGGTNTPELVKWSHPADPGTVPISWDETDTTKDTGEYPLSDSKGGILDMLPLHDVNVIYKEHSTWGMQFTGGPFVYRFYKIFSNVGMLTQRCVAEHKGNHFVVTEDDIVVHDTRHVQSVLDNRMRRWLHNIIDPTYYRRCFVINNKRAKEMWFCFPENNETECTMALIWNWKDNTVFVRDLPNILDGNVGLVDVPGGTTFNDLSGTFNEQTQAFDAGVPSRSVEALLLAKYDVTTPVLYKGDSTAQFAGTSFLSKVERQALPLVGSGKRGEETFDIQSYKTVRAIWPHFDAQAGTTLNVYVGAQSDFATGVQWNGPFPFVVGTDQKIDCLVTGRIISIRYEATTNVDWSLQGYDVDVEFRGAF